MSQREDLIIGSLERVAEIAGDPNAQVYARLFREHPEFEELFCMDKDGGVQANMLTTSLNCVIGVAEGNRTPKLLLEAARVHHDGYGLGHKDIDVMFEVMRDEFREILADEWTEQIETAWTSLLAELSEIGREVEL